MRIPIHQIDAFAQRVFEGNPAAVMPLPGWLPDDLLQAIAAENNLSETAFYVDELPVGVAAPGGPAYHLRWFTPAMEVDLCGHATLATAGHLLDRAHPHDDEVAFWTRSGWLRVARGARSAELVMDFPSEDLRPLPEGDGTAAAARAALGVRPQEALRGTDLVLVLVDEAAVRAVAPDFPALARLPVRGVAVTAQGGGGGVDFVSRWFGARAGVAEDPVTGSAHSAMAPYWAARLGRARLTARQLSARGGTVVCEVVGDRVRLTGSYRRYLDGTVTVPAPAA